MADEPTNNTPGQPGIMSEVVAAASGGAAAYGGFKLGRQIFPTKGLLSTTGCVAVAAVSALGVSGMVYNLMHKRAFNKAVARGDIHLNDLLPPQPTLQPDGREAQPLLPPHTPDITR